jgi:hypothetical protein
MRPISHPDKAAPRRFCLTELSLAALLTCALGVSALLWLAVFAVL